MRRFLNGVIITMRMGKSIFLCLIIFFSWETFGQNPQREFGDIDLNDFKMSASDTTEAVVIFDKGNVVVEPNSVIGTTFKRHLRIKIIKKSALHYGNFEFIVDRNAFTRPRGVTYNLENGSISKSPLEAASVIEARYNKYADIVTIAFPHVKEGSILELSYLEKYQNLFLPGWKFQCSIPTLWSEYSLLTPKADYTTHIRGNLKPTKFEEKFKGNFKSWTMTNVPPFKTESLMPDEKVYIASIEFGTSFKTWLSFRDYMISKSGFGSVSMDETFLNEKLYELTLGIADSLQKIKIISDFIKDQIPFNGTLDFLSDRPSEVVERKYGSAGDLNLLFGSLLRKAGFKVNMVLLSTRDHGFILKDFPSARQFNYVICQVAINNKELFLDATDKLLPFDYLPMHCFNHQGFLVSNEVYGWVGIEPQHRNKTYVEANLSLNRDGHLSGKFAISKFEYAGYQARKSYVNTGETVLKTNLIENPLWEVSAFTVKNIDAIEEPVIGAYEGSLSEYAAVSNDIIVLNPHIFQREILNPFTETTREYPIDFGELTDNFVVTNILIPDGYEVEALPENKVFTLSENAARCMVTVSKIGNRIIVISRLQINKTLFQAFEYLNLKEFYSRIIAKKSEHIVLKRK